MADLGVWDAGALACFKWASGAGRYTLAALYDVYCTLLFRYMTVTTDTTTPHRKRVTIVTSNITKAVTVSGTPFKQTARPSART